MSSTTPEFAAEPLDRIVVERYEPDPRLPEAVIVDFDGTLAHMDRRGPYEFHRVGEDRVDPAVKRLVSLLAPSVKIVVLTGRDDSCEAESRAWLADNEVPFDELHMRAAGDRRSDARVKFEIFDTRLRSRFHVIAAIDDRNSVVEMWRRLGIKCLQAQDGDF
ncbi:polynucleotide kinase [Corynebacterium sanguinis]|uniref:phosphatase domain-containing protein n=1 Tax=Actinomycetes TaxID=1760 RepID=UPI001A9E24D5|nr:MULTISPECIES: polynucleotide kinase [Actinomycetes]MCT1453456.1 polynucleotide kinase [Corynebacterium sp. p3-SID1145]MCT1462553.1 polynucleotide kinase [Corynebacterium sp. p3-SID1140]MDN8622660.1 polynucleotide kinase [Corynebacterium sanguinis]